MCRLAFVHELPGMLVWGAGCNQLHSIVKETHTTHITHTSYFLYQRASCRGVGCNHLHSIVKGAVYVRACLVDVLHVLRFVCAQEFDAT